MVSQNPWWQYWHDKFLLPNGEEADYFYAETNGSSMIIPLLDDGRLILVSQYRYLREKQSVEFPCGSLASGELPAQAAERELLEETGWKSTNFIKVGAYEALNGLVKDASHVFVADELEQVAEPVQDAREEIEVIYRRVDEFEEMIKRGEIWDGQTLAAWTMSREMVGKVLANGRN